MLWISQTNILISLIATLILMLFHFLSPFFKRHLKEKTKAFSSFSGGVAVSYVFLHMLPELVEYNKPIGELLVSRSYLNAFTELYIYVMALFGFIIYYGLEIIAVKEQELNQYPIVYNLHLGMFCLYNFLITYTMALRAQTSILATLLFTFAMALHFVITDRKFSKFYPHRFNHTGRFILITFLLIGWITSVIFDPVNIMLTSFMVAFLAGSVLLNVFREELPEANIISFRAFSLGAILVSVILLLQTFFTMNVIQTVT